MTRVIKAGKNKTEDRKNGKGDQVDIEHRAASGGAG